MTRKPLYPDLVSSSLFASLPPALLEQLEPELELVRLAEGEVLVRQGEVGDAMYVLVAGELEVRITPEGGQSVVVDRLVPRANVGEMALVAGQKRSATVLASRPSELVRLSSEGFARLAGPEPALYEAVMREVAPRLQRVQLGSVLEAWFHAVGPADVHEVQNAVEWVHLAAGERLYEQGDPADGMYLLVSGRLRLLHRRPGGGERTLAEIGRGESVGEYAVLEDAPRAESVVALRDSHLVRLERDLVASRPQVVARIARTVLERAQRSLRPAGRADNGVRTIAIVPAGEGAPAGAVARRLAARLRNWGRVLELDAAAVDRAFGRDGVARTPRGASAEPPLTHWINERETEHAYTVFEADASLSPWTLRCIRHADAVLVVADAGGDPAPGPVEREATRGTAGNVQLVLVHPDDAERPVGTARWLAPRGPLPFHHLRLGTDGDAARLARRLTGRAAGLVFSGGGARGYTHIGLIRAVEELGIDVDMVAGTSMGALIGGAYALRREYAFCYEAAAAFGDPKKLIDRTLPLVALTESRGVTELFRHMFADARIEDLWIPFSCVSANLTRAEPVVHESGPLWEAVRASTAIPGVFTPVVHQGDVLVDGGVMNNFPVDLMRERVGTGIVIGSNAYTQSSRSGVYDFGPSISGWKVLLQRTLPWGKRERYPSILGTLIRATSLSSTHLSEIAQSLTDLTVQYPTQEFGNLDFDRYDELIEIGYRLGREELERWLAEREAVAAPAEGVTA